VAILERFIPDCLRPTDITGTGPVKAELKEITMEATLLHYFNESTDQEYLVIKLDDDEEDYREDGYKLLNKCPLVDADLTLPLSTIFTRD